VFLKVPFFKRTEICESLLVLLLKRIWSNLIVPVNVTSVTIHIVKNACIAISASRCCYHAKDGH